MSSEGISQTCGVHPSVASPPSPAHEPLARLLRWAATRGAVAPKLALDPSEPRCFRAAAPISPLEPIIILPQSLLLHAGTALSDPEYGPAFRALRAEMAAASPQPQQAAQEDVRTSGAAAGPPSAAAASSMAAVPHSYWDSGGLSDRDLLCMYLILERARGSASAWAPYIDILPSAYDDPAWWAPPALRLLRGTRIARAVAAYEPGLRRLAAAMARLAQLHAQMWAGAGAPEAEKTQAETAGCGGGSAPAESAPAESAPAPAPLLSGWACSLEAARWARSAVWSRSFTIRGLRNSGGGGGSDEGSGGDGRSQPAEAPGGEARERRLEVCQVPVLDMIDHAEGCTAMWHTGPEGRDDFVWLRREALEQGCLLSNNYGSKDNQELLLAYGFVLWPNDREYVAISLASGGGGGGGGGEVGIGEGGAGSTRVAAAAAAAAGAAGVEAGGPRSHLLGDPMEAEVDGAAAAAAVASTGEEEKEEEENDAGPEGCEEDVQAAAEAVQRRLVATAAGLPGELRLTLADPLPEQLLQATRVALSSGPRLYFSASDALSMSASAEADGVGEQKPPPPEPSVEPPAAVGAAPAPTPHGSAAGAASGATPSPSPVRGDGAVAVDPARAPALCELLQPYDAVSELRVLGTLVAQLEARLAAMVSSDQEVYDILGLEPPPPPLAPAPESSPRPRPSPAAATDPAAEGAPNPKPQPRTRPQLLLPPDWMTVYGGNPQYTNGGDCGGEGQGAAVMSGDGHHGERDGSEASGESGRHVPSPAAAAALAALSRWQEEAQQEAAERPGPGLGPHARLALAVVNGQRAVLTEALRRARERMAGVITRTCAAAAVPALCSEALCGTAQSSRGAAPVGTAQPSNGPGSEDGDGDEAGPCLELLLQPGHPQQQQQQPSGGPPADGGDVGRVDAHAVPGGGGGDGDSWPLLPSRVAVRMRRSVGPGAELLRVPLEHCLAAPAPSPASSFASASCRDQLLAQLVLGAAPLLLQPQPQSYDREEVPHAPARLLRQLLQHVPPPPAVRLMLPPPPPPPGAACGGGGRSGDGDGSGWGGGRCLALLEGTPAGSEYEAAAVELQDNLNDFRRRLPALTAALSATPAAPPPGTTARRWPAEAEEEEAQGGSSAAACRCFLGASPRAAFWLYCWAREVVERCSVEVEMQEMGEGREWPDRMQRGATALGAAAGEQGASADANVEQQGQTQTQTQQHERARRTRRLWLVAPLLWALPKELVTAALRLECHPGSAAPASAGSASGRNLQRQPPPPPPPSSSCSSSVGGLECGWVPAPVSVPGLHLVVRAACPLRAGLLLHPACLLPTARDADGVMARYGPEPLAHVVRVAARGAQQAAGGIGGRGVVEGGGFVGWWAPLSPQAHGLELLPAEDDPSRARKLRLAARLGLGSQHYLGSGGRGAQLATAALHLMLQPTDQEEAEGRSRGRGFGKGRMGEAGAAVAANAAWTELAGLGRDGGSLGGSVPGGAELLAASRRALSRLGAWPPDSSTAKAARKLLRREVADAARRLETEGREEELGLGPAAGPDAEGVGGGRRQAGAGGWALPLAGVRDYVANYVAVLKEWRQLLSTPAAAAATAGRLGNGAPAAARPSGTGKRRNVSSTGREGCPGHDGNAEGAPDGGGVQVTKARKRSRKA